MANFFSRAASRLGAVFVQFSIVLVAVTAVLNLSEVRAADKSVISGYLGTPYLYHPNLVIPGTPYLYHPNLIHSPPNYGDTIRIAAQNGHVTAVLTLAIASDHRNAVSGDTLFISP